MVRGGSGPLVSDPGGQNWSSRRRLAAGEAERGGGSAFARYGHQTGGGEHLRAPGNEPQLLVVMVELGVAGDVAGDDFGGRRSSGADENGATVHGRNNG